MWTGVLKRMNKTKEEILSIKLKQTPVITCNNL